LTDIRVYWESHQPACTLFRTRIITRVSSYWKPLDSAYDGIGVRGHDAQSVCLTHIQESIPEVFIVNQGRVTDERRGPINLISRTDGLQIGEPDQVLFPKADIADAVGLKRSDSLLPVSRQSCLEGRKPVNRKTRVIDGFTEPQARQCFRYPKETGLHED